MGVRSPREGAPPSPLSKRSNLMMAWLQEFLIRYPELALFLVIAGGYWIGSFKAGAFSLGPVTGALFVGLLVAAALVLALALLMMWTAAPMMRLLGVTGANVANRLSGVVLGALAVQFVMDGLRSSF